MGALFNMRLRCAKGRTLLTCLGRFVTNTVISTLVVSYWRGLWLVQDFYGCTKPLAFCSASAVEHGRSGAQSELVGVSLALVAICTRHMLVACDSKNTVGAHFLIVSQTLLLGASAVSLWRGCWYLTDNALPTSKPAWLSHLGSHLLGTLVLVLCHALSSVLAPPAVLAIDTTTVDPGAIRATKQAAQPTSSTPTSTHSWHCFPQVSTISRSVLWPKWWLQPSMLRAFATHPPLLLKQLAITTSVATRKIDAAVLGHQAAMTEMDACCEMACCRNACKICRVLCLRCAGGGSNGQSAVMPSVRRRSDSDGEPTCKGTLPAAATTHTCTCAQPHGLGSRCAVANDDDDPAVDAVISGKGKSVVARSSKGRTCYFEVWPVIDVLLSIGIVAHAVVWCWRGAWLILDEYEWKFSDKPADLCRTAWMSTLVGLLMSMVSILTATLATTSDANSGMFMSSATGANPGAATITGARASTGPGADVVHNARLQSLKTVAMPWGAAIEASSAQRAVAIIPSRIQPFLRYILGWCAINTWRGVWYLWDYYDGVTLTSAWTSHLVGVTGLFAMGALRSVLAPPAALFVDS